MATVAGGSSVRRRWDVTGGSGDVRPGSWGGGPGRWWQIRDSDEHAGSLSVALAAWRGGVAALLPGSSGSTHRQWPVCQGSHGGSAVVDGRRIWVARSGALKAVWMVHKLSVGFS
uniref:Uncharacterized protein n=1 Tax=Aegilops tauschii TaxID=37682 RepID=R7WEL9_AEGTA